MADVKSYQCFPTMIHEFRGEQTAKSHTDMLNVIKFESKGDELHQHSAFGDFSKRILKCNKHILDTDKYQYEDVEITNMWGNTLLRGDDHPPHTHSNNILSGVYYLRASEEASPIQFFDPRAQAQVLRPKNTPNWDNASMVQFESIQGRGFIFPSWLMHWVPPTEDERISISWNIIVRGNYCEPNTLQNAYI